MNVRKPQKFMKVQNSLKKFGQKFIQAVFFGFSDVLSIPAAGI